jgi:hypothetical protein
VPFSAKQLRYMWVHNPPLARKWAHEVMGETSIYGMGITVDIPAGTKAQVFEKLDKVRQTGNRAAIAIGALAGSLVFLGVAGIIKSRKRG